MLKVTIDLRAVRHNYRVLKAMTRAELMPVVKSDAYGHGMLQVSRVLAEEGAKSFFVGSVMEGADLGRFLPDAEIYSLMGPIEDQDYQIIPGSNLTVLVHTLKQLQALATLTPRRESIRMGLKFDTGMGRLGFKPWQAAPIRDYLLSNPHLELKIICSHLACADEPEMTSQVRKQFESFEKISQIFDQAGLNHKKSMANSAAILQFPDYLTGAVRPGIALYGGNPFTGTALESHARDLRQAMNASAPVLAVQELRKGQGISYGLTFTAPRDMRVAIIGCGYADNYSRILSNRSWMLHNGQRLPLIGRVCMQLSAVDASFDPGISAGDRVFILGGDESGKIDVHELAGWWGTISYEVFCLLGKNPKTFINP